MNHAAASWEDTAKQNYCGVRGGDPSVRSAAWRAPGCSPAPVPSRAPAGRAGSCAGHGSAGPRRARRGMHGQQLLGPLFKRPVEPVQAPLCIEVSRWAEAKAAAGDMGARRASAAGGGTLAGHGRPPDSLGGPDGGLRRPSRGRGARAAYSGGGAPPRRRKRGAPRPERAETTPAGGGVPETKDSQARRREAGRGERRPGRLSCPEPGGLCPRRPRPAAPDAAAGQSVTSPGLRRGTPPAPRRQGPRATEGLLRRGTRGPAPTSALLRDGRRPPRPP